MNNNSGKQGAAVCPTSRETRQAKDAVSQFFTKGLEHTAKTKTQANQLQAG